MYLFHRHIDLASELKKAVGLAVGAAIYSAGLNLFLIPNHIIDGGITGISLLVQALTGIPFSVLIVLLNLPFSTSAIGGSGRGSRCLRPLRSSSSRSAHPISRR